MLAAVGAALVASAVRPRIAAAICAPVGGAGSARVSQRLKRLLALTCPARVPTTFEKQRSKFEICYQITGWLI
jgi:hypothetical protein